MENVEVLSSDVMYMSIIATDDVQAICYKPFTGKEIVEVTSCYNLEDFE